ncbi:MAG: alpha/beta fold hydrolase [Longimicrobiales bacterium]|nr:alpha/beta fold hydrolase [Longimicrobiales bacterium]
MTLLAVLLVGMSWGSGPSPAQEIRPFVPVLLVPGWFDTAAELEGLRTHLRSGGWPVDRVAAVTFADPTGGNHDHAHEIADAVDSLLARTGAERVDIVAHSMGGLATRLYVREHPGKVRRVVFMASPHRGTLSAYFAFGKGRAEMLPGSAFLDSLNAGPAVPPGLAALTVRTLLDTHIIPGSSATLPGVPDVTVCCASHAGLTRNLEAFRAVRDFLRGDGAG